MMWNNLLRCAPLLLLSQLSTPAHAQSIETNPPDEIVRFNFRFGLFDDEQTPNTEVIRTDVESVICQTQYFMSQLVQNATESQSIHAKATEIDWAFYRSHELPIYLNFTVLFMEPGKGTDVNWVDEEILIAEMEKMGQEGLQRYITDWVWKAEPLGDNLFTNVNRMAFDGVKQAFVEGTLDNAECPETPAPSMMPTITPVPTESPAPTPIGPTNSPRPTSVADAEAAAEAAADANEEDALNSNAGTTQAPGAIPAPTMSPGASNPGDGDSGEIADKPDNGDTSSGLPPNTNDQWPFDGKETLADVQPMVDFKLTFDMEEAHERSPTDDDMNGMLCQLDKFFTDHMRKVLVDNAIVHKAVYIDWFFMEEADKEDIVVNFTSYATYGDAIDTQIAAADVLNAMKLSSVELQDFVKDYIWNSEPLDVNIFSNTVEVGLGSEIGASKPVEAMFTQADCTPKAPTVSPAPTTQAEADAAADAANGDTGDNVNNGAASAGANPEDFGEGAQRTEIIVNFVVSNLEKITDPRAVNASGLIQSFPVFANEVLSNMTKRQSTRRWLREHSGRRLRYSTVSGSARVDTIEEYPCPDGTLNGLTCHTAEAKYDVIMTADENIDDVQLDATDASQTAVDDGSYDGVLQRVDPDTPLYIGIMRSENDIPPGSKDRGVEPEDDSSFPWWLILIALLLLLLCCCICLYCWMFPRKGGDSDNERETMVEKEVLVEEFEDEPDKANNNGPPDQNWIDDEMNQGVMVPYGQDPNTTPHPDAASGSMVPYEPGQGDAEQRRAILDGKHD